MSIGNFVVAGCAIGVAVAVVLSGVAIGNNKSEPVLDMSSLGRLVIDKFNKMPDNAYEIDWDNSKLWVKGSVYSGHSDILTWQEFRDICAFRISEIHKDNLNLEKIKNSHDPSLVNKLIKPTPITYEHCISPFKKS